MDFLDRGELTFRFAEEEEDCPEEDEEEEEDTVDASNKLGLGCLSTRKNLLFGDAKFDLDCDEGVVIVKGMTKAVTGYSQHMQHSHKAVKDGNRNAVLRRRVTDLILVRAISEV